MSEEILCHHGDTTYILVERAQTFLTARNMCKERKGILAEHIDAAGYQIISDCGNTLKQYWIGLIYNQNFCHEDPKKTYSWFTEKFETCRSPSPLSIPNQPQANWCQAVTIRPRRSHLPANNTTPSAKIYSCNLSKPYICQIKTPPHSITTPKVKTITMGSNMEFSSVTEQSYSSTEQIDLKNGNASAQRMTASTRLATIIGPAAGGALILMLLLFLIACWFAKKKNKKKNNQTPNTGETFSTDSQPIYFSPDLNSEEYVREETQMAHNPIYNVSRDTESSSNNDIHSYELVEETKPQLPSRRSSSTFVRTDNYEVAQNSCYDTLNIHQRASKECKASYQKPQEAIDLTEVPKTSRSQSESTSFLPTSGSSSVNSAADSTE